MGSIILVVIFIVVFILVIRFVAKDDAPSQSKSNKSNTKSQELTPIELSELKPEEFTDYLFEKYVPGKPVKNRITTNTINRLHDIKTKEAISKIEFTSHKRILEESLKLIQTTKNLETLLGRYDVALEQYFWIRDQISNGVPLYFELKGHFHDELKEHANYHIHRIAENIFKTHKSKISMLKTEKAKESHKEKTLILLSECINSLKQTANTNEWISKINALQNKL